MDSQHGIDISERRLDDLDKQILHFALGYKAGDKVAIDLGCGYGRVSIMLAMAGFEVYCYDVRDLHEHFATVSESLELEGKLHFIQKDITKLSSEDLPKRASIVIAQRVLHHMQFAQAQALLTTLAEHLGREGRVFASFSGLSSEIARDYPCKDASIHERFCEVSAENQERFNITTPVCLYDRGDVEQLFAVTPLQQHALYESAFGNVKAIYVV